MKKLLALFALATVGCATTNNAPSDFPDLPPPPDLSQETASFYASNAQTVTATVESLDHQSRAIALRRSDGELIEVVAGENVTNLHEVVVGDVLTANYEESVSIQLVDDSGANQTTARTSLSSHADIGTTAVMAQVQAVHLDTNTFELMEPGGTVKKYTAREPQHLRTVTVGNRVKVTTSPLLATMVEHASSTNDSSK